jgi:hypothetical protein
VWIERNQAKGVGQAKQLAEAGMSSAVFQPAFGPARANPASTNLIMPPFIKSRRTVQPLKEIPVFLF